MELTELQKHWNAYGEIDPLWAILTESDKKGNRWDEAEFFQVGRTQIAKVLAEVAALGLPVRGGRALDFGCGVGRLTQALCGHFQECRGVDIAPSMIALAHTHNKFGDRCRYDLNDRGDLSLFASDSFDLVYTWAVLQHIHPTYSCEYLKEFVRVLAPGGVLVFQLPIGRVLRPLDDSGYRADLSLVEPPEALDAGAKSSVRVRVKNLGEVPWIASPYPEFRIRLGNHWLDGEGKGHIWDDGRAALPRDVAPAEEVEIRVDVTAPSRPGRYALEIDLVQEGVCWFQDKGSTSTRATVRVNSRRRRLSEIFRKPAAAPRAEIAAVPEAPAPTEFVPSMEMHGVDVPTVRGLIEGAGGTIVDIQQTVGGGWDHGTYCVTKR